MLAFAAFPVPAKPTSKSLLIFAYPGVIKLPTFAVPVIFAVLRTVKYCTLAVLLAPVPSIFPPVVKLPTLAVPVTFAIPPTLILPLVKVRLPLVEE